MAIRFGRAQGRCERCGRARGQIVYHLGDGRWRDARPGRRRDDWGRRIRVRSGAGILDRARRTRVVPAAAHRDHDTADNADANRAAFCHRGHMIRDRPEHQRRRRRTLFQRKAMGDPFGGPYARDTVEKAVSYPDRGRDCGSGHRSDRRRRSHFGQLDVSRCSKAWAMSPPPAAGASLGDGPTARRCPPSTQQAHCRVAYAEDRPRSSARPPFHWRP